MGTRFLTVKTGHYRVGFDLFAEFLHPIERRVMKCLGFLLLFAAYSMSPLTAQDCQSVLQEMKLPQKLKTRGKPKVLKWEDIDKTLNSVDQALQGKSCSFTFAQLFSTKQEEARFPLTNSVIRLVPEESLANLKVFTREGDELGKYVGRVRYERSGGLYARDSYSLFYFQYEDLEGGTESVGSRLLLDEFTVPWSDLSGRVAVSTE